MTRLEIVIDELQKASIVADELLTELVAKQKDLEKPPPHKWEHGDVFKTSLNIIMVYLKFAYEPPQTVCVVGNCGGLVERQYFDKILQDGKFLFNIKEKL